MKKVVKWWCTIALMAFLPHIISAQVFKQDIERYKNYEGELELRLVFNETVAVFAIVDSVHYLPIIDQAPKEAIILDFAWTGNIHNDGTCDLLMTMAEEKFLICKNKQCDTLTVFPPLFYARKEKLKWRYRNTSVSWDEGKDEMIVE